MNQKHREILDMCCEEVIPQINLHNLWPKLFEHKIYNRDDVNIPHWTVSEESYVHNVSNLMLQLRIFTIRNTSLRERL